MAIINLEKENMTDSVKNKKYRELFRILIQHDPPIQKIEGCDEEGYVSFTVLLKDLGLTRSSYRQYRKEFLHLGAEILGELLIRENLVQFASVLSSIEQENYLEVVNRIYHTQFGLNINNNAVSFRFHVSLLQKILADDFKMKLKDLVKDSTQKEV